MIVLFWEYVQSMWIMCLLICLYYMLFHCSGSECLYINKFHWWDLLSYILNRIFQFLYLSLLVSSGAVNGRKAHSLNGGEGGGIVLHLPKMRGGGNCPLCAKRWEGKYPPLIILQEGKCPAKNRGGIVLPTWFEQGGKCPGGEMSGYRCFLLLSLGMYVGYVFTNYQTATCKFNPN